MVFSGSSQKPELLPDSMQSVGLRMAAVLDKSKITIDFISFISFRPNIKKFRFTVENEKIGNATPRRDVFHGGSGRGVLRIEWYNHPVGSQPSAGSH
jgi:hypothetical protein